ncbi:hypothetical protein EDD15DRAFT_2195254 [Pisolithus albus]|nr:hypothetical protein EDD15DRAFT_2195254 [Pisolithus albus]
MGTLQTVYGEAVNDFSLLEWSRRSTSTLPTLTKTRSVLKNKTNSRGPPYITRLPGTPFALFCVLSDFSLLEWSRQSTSTLPALAETGSVLKNKTNSRGPPYITRLPGLYILPGFPNGIG